MPLRPLPPTFTVRGIVRYRSQFRNQPRIVVPLWYETLATPSYAIVDTASTRSIITREVAYDLNLVEPAPDSDLGEIISTFGRIPGWIERVNITFITADSGSESLPLSIPVFVPLQSSHYDGPNFLGMTGLLDTIRFAIDPAERLFYFSDW